MNRTSKSVNIIDELGPSSDFFYQLLDDDKGTIVATTENDQRVQNVRRELFRKWMQGGASRDMHASSLLSYSRPRPAPKGAGRGRVYEISSTTRDLRMRASNDFGIVTTPSVLHVCA